MNPGRLPKQLRVIARRHWRRLLRLRERVQISDEAIHLGLAAIVGLCGGLINLAFYRGTGLAMRLTLHHQGDPVEVANMLPHWQRVVATGVGGLLGGLVLAFGLRFAGRQGTNFLEAVAVGDGRLSFRAGMVKAFSSLCSIVSGGSIGREGAITQLSAMCASQIGRGAKSPPYRLRLLVACGAAAGIAAPYNAPIGGAVFAAMIVLGNFSMTTFAPLVTASAVSCVVSRGFFGMDPLYDVPDFPFMHILDLPWFLILGALAGLLGAFFMQALHASERLFRRIPAPLYVRMMLGGLLVGIIAIEFPEVWGNGYLAANRILQDHYVFALLAGLFFAKLAATLLTVGSGAVGGVFTPTLFLGTALGSLCGMTLHHLGLAESMPNGAFALVGMSSVLAATTQSPLLAVIMVFEISLDYSLMPAVMLGCGMSSVVARRLHPRSIYAETERLQEVVAGRETDRTGVATEQTVGDVMREPVPPLRMEDPLRTVAKRFLSSSNNFLPVIDEGYRLVGMVALQDLKEFLDPDQELQVVIAYDVMRPPPPVLFAHQRLAEVLSMVLASELRNIPVVSSREEM
ncbi:MAG: ClcB-like voltage-gated chloride channel protein, partial [Candidatus Eisenbacteria bacterium]|nr:ClcB-like voltage-gated chloride channel protein [Candidatus Eisenbacteria bacterium]